uniref:EvC ciliary complex subunit 2 n=1 Tax=Mus spicilegus TaxID=10103 RepID=A0A8C6I3U9_MUSSI
MGATGPTGAGGRATWVLAGNILTAALVLGAGPRALPPSFPALGPGSPSRPGPAGPWASSQYSDISREARGPFENGVIFQKCSLVSGQSESQTMHVQLSVNNTRTPTSVNLSNLLMLDEITGLAVKESPGNNTQDGIQTFRKSFLQVGECYSVSYTASLDPTALGTGESLDLPARLIFQSPSQNRTQLKAPFTITVEEKIMVLPNHGLHAAGFMAAFLISLLLTLAALFFLARGRCLQGGMLSRCRIQHPENKLEPSPFTSANGVSQDLSLNDQVVAILTSEEPGSMLQALEELEIATLNQADADLEACRNQISKDIIALLMKNLVSGGHLSPQTERKMAAAFKKQFLLLENEIQEEYERKMLALTAECDLEMRKKTENQYQREMVAMEEAEEVLKRVSERSAAECSSLLRTLHGLEQEDMQRSLTLDQAEDFAQAHRQLAVFQRNELHSIVYTQIQSAVSKGELRPEVAKMMLQDYSKTQESVEELMDFFQATKRYHLSKRFGHREYLVQRLQAMETRVQGLLNTAATQLTSLIHKHERAGYLDEDQMETLLERAQTETFSIKQKLDNDLKQEKKRLHQRLITRRRRELLQKHKEQQKEQVSLGEASSTAEDAVQYLHQWRSVMAEHTAALEELQERLDQAALDDLRVLTVSLSEKATEELRRLQSTAMTQELLKRSAPWLFLQQILEEHSRESAARTTQLEAEERERGQELVQGVRQRLQQDAPEAYTEEQAELRHWEHLVFMKLCCAAISLSEEDLLRVRQEAQGCFSQLDRSLALPRVRARVLQQQAQMAWREAEFRKLDQALAAPELQSKARKLRSKGRGKADLLKKNLEDKIRLFEERAPVELADQELQELERKLEEQLVQQEEAEQQRVLESWQRWAADGPGLSEPEEMDPERQVSAILRQALNKGQKLLEQHQQRVREEWQNGAVLEDSLESMEADTVDSLCSQGLRLVSYLSRMTMVPGSTLLRLLSVVLPAASQPQLLALLDAVSEKHSDHTAENESSGEQAQAEQGKRRKHQGWWKALDSRFRADLVSQGLERMLWARRKKESILKKIYVPVQERVMFPGKGSWPHLSLEPIGELAPIPITGADAMDILNTGEKIFVFRSPREPEISLRVPPRRKKNFLNAKKANRALGLD